MQGAAGAAAAVVAQPPPLPRPDARRAPGDRGRRLRRVRPPHARRDRSPRARGAARMSRHALVATDGGALAVRCLETDEVMHPGVGPLVEAELLYVRQSRLAER